MIWVDGCKWPPDLHGSLQEKLRRRAPGLTHRQAWDKLGAKQLLDVLGMLESLRTKKPQRIFAENQPLVLVADAGVVNARPLHRREITGRIRAEQQSFRANLPHRPLDQVRHDALCAGGVHEDVAALRRLDRAHLVAGIAVPTTTEMRQDQAHLGEIIRPRNEILGQAVALATVR